MHLQKTDSICKWPTFSRGTQLPIVVKNKGRSHGLNQHFKTYVLKIQQLNGKGKTESVQKLLISIPVSENKPKYQKHIYPENPEIYASDTWVCIRSIYIQKIQKYLITPCQHILIMFKPNQIFSKSHDYGGGGSYP